MTYLTTHLPFPSSSTSLPPPRSQLIISDTLSSPGNFAVYHLVSSALGKEKRKVIWVDFKGEGRSSWEAILKKIGTPLPPLTSHSFIHISPSSLPSSIKIPNKNTPSLFDIDEKPILRETYDYITSHLTDGSLLILDGLSELDWLGFSPLELSKFVRAVFAKVKLSNSILVSTIHADHLPLSSTIIPSKEAGESDLLYRLLRLGQGCWWRVSHLPSGRSGDVMGEISSHPLTNPIGLKDSQKSPYIPRSNPLQYRLEPNTVRVFPKGTGRGFL
ncbi:hypothetical protein L486_02118 [Kwoniella mangroviensis CBS 10435]|uniref:Elongator complex protein 5 n=1 Tax=Kwoniella mangroviensis CBS 10435 TaxID=1331196 RepID=A0A1B9IVA5_9TREE|nr:uncharacterized protein I203_04717 [Kwoniella mangroviensis CBS 8507]OCF59453.1 hypothetical protein L486_02118 [Kwoniella mangroviensis CBS 10435]OCF66384.1 hypothetical protein I203_04717 [Kwoniella mangroviensis CBS 8507]OCF73522.1 hypothetical protein I204_05365 [Kwoniella mangroviensis CBS 8886]